VADEDPSIVEFIIRTLREDGHAAFHAYDVLSATQLAIGLEVCDLFISNTRVEGADGIQLIRYLHKRMPALPIIYLANTGRSTLEIEAQLPANVLILREPWTAEKIRGTVAAILDGKGTAAIPPDLTPERSMRLD
jgi:DNA-binding NtrC family response regulator